MSFRSFRFFCALIFCVLTALFPQARFALAQENQSTDDIHLKPIYVTARIFQIKAKRGSYDDLSNQIFRMKTSSLAEHEKWIKAFAKTYPGMEVSLLRTDPKRVFRTSKPTVLSLSKQPDGRAIEVQLLGAQSPGDGITPGTSLISEVALHFGNDLAKKPVTYAVQPMEIESGMTYFFASTNLKLSSVDYIKYVRPNAPPEKFDGNDIFLIFAFSVDLDKQPQPARYFDERQSIELQEKATKKTEPIVPATLREAGLGGVVRVQIEISTEGKVSAANVYGSTFPEMNLEAMAAARQWEFPAELFAQDKNPITGFLTFNFPAKKQPPIQSGKQDGN